MVPGLQIVENWITPEEEVQLLERIGANHWELSLKRRVQQFGPIYNYSTKKLDPAQREIPEWIIPFLDRIEEWFERKPEQIIVNEYKIGQGISKHIDSPLFGPTVASLSLMNDAVMEMGRYSGEKMILPVPKLSLAVMKDAARNDWYHAIPNVAAERISITFRTVK